MPSVSEHNDHYYEAEDEIEVEVSGMMKLSFDPAELKSLTENNIDEHISIDIDSIDDVTVREDN